MHEKTLDRALAVTALLSCLTVAGMVVGIVAYRFGQDPFQTASPLNQLVGLLAGDPEHAFALRLNLGLDNFFIVAYTAFFAVLAVRLRPVLDPWILAVALASLLTTTVLDALENHHILMVLRSVELGMPLAQWQFQAQQMLSQVKFHASYVGSFLFAIGLWRLGGLGRWIAGSLWAYVPLGVLISAMPAESARPFALGRVLFFVGAFLLSGIFFLRQARATVR